ncbi:tyrosine-type recombinase/integrase [Methylobacterium brachiatum]|uniref:tyrosine-type recombinase/integrase n=1 Tax=Methylobacterium brachiatum TaxID=269660 RepID=UPI0013CE87FB|nr:tyrosine-type recombinase/integrase [Methylobacterium brachiatum]
MRELLFGEVEGAALTETINSIAPSGETRALEQRVGRLAFWVLQRQGIEVDDETRLALLRRIAVAALDAGHALKRMAAGDYRPDLTAERFPPYQAKKTAGGITFTDLFERWRKETKPAASTATTWRGIVASLAKSAGTDDAANITSRDVVLWKDGRIAEGRALKTIADSDLACIKSLYRYGLANHLVTANPADGVRVTIKKRAGERMLGYCEQGVARLLDIASRETHPARRWLPWLAALTGARIGELAALWGSSVVEKHGIIGIEIAPSPDGATLKTEGSERFVPLHPALIEAGFVTFARSKGRAPLFYGKPARGSSEGRHPSKGTANHLASWIREQGFDNERIAPAHGLRHYWKSTASRLGIPDSVADAIQGHAATGAAATYRHISVEQAQQAVVQFIVPTLKRETDAAPITDTMIAPASELGAS